MRSVVGGNSLTGTATRNPPPRLMADNSLGPVSSGDTSLVRPPATFSFPAVQLMPTSPSPRARPRHTRIPEPKVTAGSSPVSSFGCRNSSWKSDATAKPFLVDTQSLCHSYPGMCSSNGKTNLPRSGWWRSRFLAGKHGRPGDHSASVTVPAGSVSATFTTTEPRK